MQTDRESEVNKMSEQKGAYAHGTLPGMRELVKVVDENKALQGEVRRLRAALKQITTVIEVSPVKTYQRMEQIANQALSSSPDTGDTRKSRTE